MWGAAAADGPVVCTIGGGKAAVEPATMVATAVLYVGCSTVWERHLRST